MASQSRFTFLSPDGLEIEPRAWVDCWAARYGNGDNPEYFNLIEKQGKLSSEDFEQVGKWKEGCLKPPNHGSWKTGTPKAYDVWMLAKAELPECPENDEVADFLKAWSEKTFTIDKNGFLSNKFGLSRSTTLLHFINGGAQYPIVDSRVKLAMTCLGCPIKMTIDGYLTYFCPLFFEIASVCGVSGTDGMRKLDTALFTCGRKAKAEKKKDRQGRNGYVSASPQCCHT